MYIHTHTGEARVVNQSSNARSMCPDNKLVAANFGKNGGNLGGEEGRWGRYGQTKLANLVFTSALDDCLRAAQSKVKALTCHPGLSATNLQVTTAVDFKGGADGMLGSIMGDAQSSEDGSMPMSLAAFGADVASGEFFGPSDAGSIGPGTKGKAIKLDVEPYGKSDENKSLLWTESEKELGEFKF